MLKRGLLLKRILLALILLIVTVASADDLSCTMPDGTTQSFAGVNVVQLVRDQSGNPTLNVRFTDGQMYPLELLRCQQISFGDGGQGRLFDLSVLVNGAPQAFPQTRLFTYQAGNFTAQPQNYQQTFPIPAQNVVSMTEIPGDNPAPGDTAGLDDRSLLGEDADFMSSTDSGEDSYLQDDMESGDYEDVSEEDLDSIESLFSDESIYGTSDPGKIRMLKLLSVVTSLLWLTTLIWLCTYAFQNGDTGWGVAMIVLCCCPPLKGFYVGRYQGGGRNIVMTLVIIELILWVFQNIQRGL